MYVLILLKTSCSCSFSYFFSFLLLLFNSPSPKKIRTRFFFAPFPIVVFYLLPVVSSCSLFWSFYEYSSRLLGGERLERVTSLDRRLGTARLLYYTRKIFTSATYHIFVVCHVENWFSQNFYSTADLISENGRQNTDHVTRTITCLLQQTNRPPSFPQ